MSLTQPRTPSLETVIDAAVSYRLSDIHTLIPGIVESYNETTKRANILPALMRTTVNSDGSEVLEALPVIPNVPILFPQAGGFFIKFPIAKGTPVLLGFCERSIDFYLAGTGVLTNPVDLRTHDLSDAVAWPCLTPLTRSIKTMNNEDLVIGEDNQGAQIKIKSGGIIEITFAAGNMLTINSSAATATLQLGNGAAHVAVAEQLKTLWNTQKLIYNAHVHPTAFGPSGPPTVPCTDWIDAIVSTSMSLPG